MVSWRLHELFGREVCGFSSREIDWVVDSSSGHDASRYSADELLRLVDWVYKRYGEKGVCYMVLHHFLDRAVDAVVSLITIYEAYKSSADVCEDFAKDTYGRLIMDEKNILAKYYRDSSTIPGALQVLKEQVGFVLKELQKHWKSVLLEILTDKDLVNLYKAIIARAGKIGSQIYRRVLISRITGKPIVEPGEQIEQDLKGLTRFHMTLINCYSK